MATYIDLTSEEEQAQELARFVTDAKAKGGEKDEAFYEGLIKLNEGDRVEFWNKLLKESSILFSEASDKDVENYFMVVCSSLKKAGVQIVNQVIGTVLQTITTPAEEKPLLRLRILNNTYNILDNSPSDRYEIFHAIMKFTVGLKHSEVMLPHFKDIEKRIKEWGIEGNQVSELYKSIRDILRVNQKNVEAYQWDVKYLTTLADEKVVQEAKDAVVNAIATPELYQFDELISIPVVRQLEKESSNLYKLLEIFVGKSLEDFKTFASQNSDIFKTNGLDEEECVRKMRILTLASLGAENHVIPYSTIAKSLQIEESQVEIWVVSAISEGVIEARMDQLRSEVVVTRSLQRVFTKEQWKALSDNLTAWSKNVKTLLGSLEDAKKQHQAAIASQT